MSGESHLINKFNSGELSRLVHSRVDYNKRDGGAEVMKNFRPLVQGPITSRSGTVYVGASGSARSGLIPFNHSIGTDYAIEVQANMFRFIKNHAFITRAVGTVTAAAVSNKKVVLSGTIANPCVITTTTAHTFANGDYVSFSGISSTLGTSKLNLGAWVVSGSATPALNILRDPATHILPNVNWASIQFSPALVAAANGSIFTGGSITLAAHGLVTGDVISITGMTGGTWTTLNGNYYRVIKLTTDTFAITTLSGICVDSSGFGVWSSGGTITWVGVWHPYTQTDLFNTTNPEIMSLGYCQSLNTLFLANSNHYPSKLVRTDDDTWTFSPFKVYDGPYGDRNISTGSTLAFGTTSNGSTTDNTATGSITLSSVTGWNNNQGFLQTDVGRHIRMPFTGAPSRFNYYKIASVTSSTVAVYTHDGYGTTNISLTADCSWQPGIWCETNGFPSCVSFYQDRLCWGGMSSFPERIDMSISGVYNHYAPTLQAPDNPLGTTAQQLMGKVSFITQDVGDESAISLSMLSSELNYILWITGTEKGLVVGTLNGEWVISAAQGAAITPTNAMAQLVAPYGSAPLQAIRVGSGLMHIQRSGRKVRALGISQQVDGFSSKDITMPSEHITQSGICSITYQKEPWTTIWAARIDGVLLSCTYDENEDAIAWARHEISPKVISGAVCTALVESVCCIPDPLLDRYDVYMIVKRVSNGTTTRSIEYFGREFILNETNGIKDAVSLDMSFSQSGSSSTIVASWLASTTCTVIADGVEFSGLTGDGSGTFTIPGGVNYRNRQVGIPFTPYYESIDLVPNSARSPQGIGKIKKITQAIPRLYKSLYGRIGRDIDHCDTIGGWAVKSISGLSTSSVSVVTTSTPHGFRTDDVVLIYGVVGSTGTDSAYGVNGETYKVLYLTDTTFSLKTMAGVAVNNGPLTYTSGGSVLKILSEYRVAEFPGDFDREAKLCIKQTAPFPITVVSVTINLDTKA